MPTLDYVKHVTGIESVGVGVSSYNDSDQSLRCRTTLVQKREEFLYVIQETSKPGVRRFLKHEKIIGFEPRVGFTY